MSAFGPKQTLGRKVLGFVFQRAHEAKATIRCRSDRTIRQLASLQSGQFRKGSYMAYKPNYGLQRADRNRAAQARSEQKQRKREEKSAQRKAERAAEIKSSSDDDKAQ